MIEIRKINALPLVVLTSFGHCGTDYLGNLFYNQKEILKIPALLYFRKIRILEKKKGINLFYEKNFNKIYRLVVRNIFGKSNIPSYKFFLSKKISIKFKKYFLKYLKYNKKDCLQKKIFLAIHYGMAKAYDIKIENLKCIFTHEHRSEYCNNYNKYFDNVKFISLYRDPRAAIAGSLRGAINHKISKEYQIDRAFFNWMTGYNFYLRQNKKKNIFLIQNEKMNGNSFKSEIQKICKSIKIKFHRSMLFPKYFKKKWHGDSVYLGKYESNKPLPKNYYELKNVIKRWRSQLSKKEIADIENLLNKSMKLFKYKNLTVISKKSLINAHISYLFGYKEKRSFFKNVYYTCKNILRRISILYFPKLAGKYFDLI